MSKKYFMLKTITIWKKKTKWRKSLQTFEQFVEVEDMLIVDKV